MKVVILLVVINKHGCLCEQHFCHLAEYSCVHSGTLQLEIEMTVS